MLLWEILLTLYVFSWLSRRIHWRSFFPGPDNRPTPAVSEAPDGRYVRADQFVFRLNPGDRAKVRLFATRFGQPYPEAADTADLRSKPTCRVAQDRSNLLSRLTLSITHQGLSRIWTELPLS